MSWSDKASIALTYDGMEHASADDGQETRSEVPEAYVKHMPFTILVRVKRTGTNKIREVKRKSFCVV